MENSRISALEVLGDAVQAMIRNWQLFLLLVSFLAVVTLILMWPVMDWYVVLLEDIQNQTTNFQTQIEQFLQEDLGVLSALALISVFFSLGITVLWTRAVIGGPEVAFEGGFPALLKRIGWSFWRYLCAVFLMMAFSLIILVPLAFMGQNIGAAVLVFIVLYFVFIFLIIAATFLLSVSLHGEARDLRLPIHKSFLYLRGNIARAAGALLLGMFIVSLIQGTVMIMLIGLITSGNSAAMAIGFFFLIGLSLIFNFLWIGYGAFYAVRAVPELKV